MLEPAQLGDQELEILRYVAGHASVTAGEVAEHFADARGVARTTVLTMMERLRRKRYLARRKTGGVYRYSSRIPKTTLLQSLIRDFADRVLDGSLEPFVSFLAGRGNLSDEQIRNLGEIIRNAEAGNAKEAP